MNLTGGAAGDITSPPVRGRGLKPYPKRCERGLWESPPVRGRGLKQSRLRPKISEFKVAPRAGARIETLPM